MRDSIHRALARAGLAGALICAAGAIVSAGARAQATTAGPCADGEMAMCAALGPYPMTRESSGTAWQPDESTHEGIHGAADGWMLMTHALLDEVYDRQDGPRGGEKEFLSGMAMTAATRALDGEDLVRLRAMLSPEPLMGAEGYPLLFATGETADGRTPLIDRQHPHDFVMELSASFAHLIDDRRSVFIYAGLPGEPAFGPPAFMHRESILDDPAAPISHHWLDSTHISEGVVTLGYVEGDLKLELSRFHGREPDQYRYRIEPGPLDSSAARLSWNPVSSLALQASWAWQRSPEQLAPDENETRAAVSALYTVRLEGGAVLASTAAYGYRCSSGRPGLPAALLESTVKPNEVWTVFARFERVRNDELLDVEDFEGPAYTVGTLSLGLIHDWRPLEHLKVGLGGLYAWNFVPPGLIARYGHDPAGMMAFVRFKVD